MSFEGRWKHRKNGDFRNGENGERILGVSSIFFLYWLFHEKTPKEAPLSSQEEKLRATRIENHLFFRVCSTPAFLAPTADFGLLALGIVHATVGGEGGS